MSIDHYENFPVASLLCPPQLRAPITAIYHFARTADDLADEGSAPRDERLTTLQRYRRALDAVASQGAIGDWPQVFAPLKRQLAQHRLPLNLLHDLLDAFEQDCGNPTYTDRPQLIQYCQRSANPIGRLLLHLYGVSDATALSESDAICTALQLINFWQDPSVDLPRGRSYFTEQDLARHGLTAAHVLRCQDTAATQAMLRELCEWAEALMRQGSPLVFRLRGRMGWELRLVVQGGLRVLERIRAMDHRTLSARPRLSALDALVLLWRALRMRRPQPHLGADA